MREPDVRECRALGREPKAALRSSLASSLQALTALDEEGKPLAMFGVSPVGLMSGRGSPWFLGRDEVFLYGFDLIARYKLILGPWLEVFSTLENIVSTDNAKAIRMLKRWGATVEGVPVVHGGVEFVPFVFARPAIQASDDAP